MQGTVGPHDLISSAIEASEEQMIRRRAVASLIAVLVLVAQVVAAAPPAAGSAKPIDESSGLDSAPTPPPQPTPQAAAAGKHLRVGMTLQRQPGAAPKTGALFAQSSTITCTDHWFINYSGDPSRILTFGGDVSCSGAMDHTADADLHLVQGGVSQDPAEAVAPHQACTACLSLSTSGTFGPATTGTTHRNFYRPVHTAPPGFVWTQWDPASCTPSGPVLSCVYTIDYSITAPPPPPPPAPSPETNPAFNPPFLNESVTADPVNTFTGSYSYGRADIAITGRGPSPLLLRSYNSLDSRAGPLGPGWTHSYAMHLAQDVTTGNVTVTGPQGRDDLYNKNTNGTYTPRAGVFSILTRNADGTFTLRHKDRSSWSFDGNGRLTQVADRYGNVSRISLNSAGQPASVADPAGRGSLIFEYNANGKLARITDWAARAVSYAYDGTGRLATVTDRAGAATSFVYDGTTHRLTSITDANGHVAVTMSYDASGRVATQKDARGLTTGDVTTMTYVTNADGTRTTTVTYPATSFEPTWHAVVEDTYDTSGFVTKRVTKPTSSSADWATTTYTYDSNGDPTSITDARGNKVEFCYDVDYDGNAIPGRRGNLTRRLDPIPPGSTSQPITLYRYDGADNLTQVVLPKGLPTNFNNPPVMCNWMLSSKINPLFTVDLGYDASATQLLSITRRYTDPDLGQLTATTRYEYGDAANLGRVTRVIPPRGNVGAIPDYTFATTLAYFGPGPSAGLLASVADPLGDKITYGYDTVGRRTSVVDALGNAPGGVAADHTWTFDYDAQDRVRFARAPAPAAGGTALTNEFRYDPVGNRAVAIDAGGQVTVYAYDVRDQLASARQSPSAWRDPASPPADVITTAYQYDPIGKLTRVLRASGDAANERATDYFYDGLGHVRRETQYPSWPSTAATLVTSFSYDPAGNRASLVDPLGKTTGFAYDSLNRLTTITYNSSNTANVSYSYDVHGNRTAMTDGTGTTTYVYDELDRALTAGSVGFRYDRDGNRTKLLESNSSSRTVSYEFDRASRLASVTDWTARTTSYDYLPDGHVQTQHNANGTSATYSYDNARRLGELWNRTASGATISRHTYTLDSLGNRTRADEMLPVLSQPVLTPSSLSIAYSYDHLSRLVSAVDQQVTTTYSYDPIGNRTQRTRTTASGTEAIDYTYDRADRIQTAGSVSYVVDANGNITSRSGLLGVDTFAYDQANHLISSSIAGEQIIRYGYDGDGNRRSKGPVVGLGYDLDVNRPLPVVVHDSLQNDYIWGHGLSHVRAVGAGVTPLQIGVVHTDGLGSIRALTAEDGSVIQTYRTDEFGVPITSDSLGAFVQPFQYAGEQRDIETGFTYLRARYYDPSIGRFMSRDPWPGRKDRPSTLNRYIYAEDNPTDLTDPAGLFVVGVCDVAAGAFYSVYGAATACITLDQSGNLGATFTVGAGAAFPPVFGSAGLAVLFSREATSVDDLSGPFIFAGLSAKVVVGFTVDVATGKNRAGQPINVVMVSGGLGSPAVYGGLSETMTANSGVNLFDLLRVLAGSWLDLLQQLANMAAEPVGGDGVANK